MAAMMVVLFVLEAFIVVWEVICKVVPDKVWEKLFKVLGI